MSETVSVARAEVVALFEALSFSMAYKWDNKRLAKKAKAIDNIVDESTELPDSIEATLITIQEAVENGHTSVVVDEAEEAEIADTEEDVVEEEAEEVEAEEDDPESVAEVAPEAPKKKKRGRPAGSKATPKAEKVAKPKAEKKVKAPGVIASICEFLGTASEKKPISKTGIVEKLVERFPDRSADSMKSTVNVQIPGRMKKEKGLDICSNDGGFWVAK